MTNEDMLRIAMEQSAEDIGCKAEDFLSGENVVVPLKIGKDAKSYYKEPISCNFISYGNNVVVGTIEELKETVVKYIDGFLFYHCFETPNLRWFNKRTEPIGYTACFMAQYYLPDLKRLKKASCGLELRVLEQEDFTELYKPEWANALCHDRRNLDVLGIGAYDKGKLAGLAACSADAKHMWQIGVDVLPEYRRKGIASTLTGNLALEIMEHEKVPFYCSAWSNVRSAGNAYKSGFIPAWVELSVKPTEKVDEING